MWLVALEIVLEERQIKPFTREYYFSVEFHGKRINHKHFVDFYVRDKAFIECKAAETLCPDHKQQLWNYMRLTKTRIGILWNFAPVREGMEVRIILGLLLWKDLIPIGLLVSLHEFI